MRGNVCSLERKPSKAFSHAGPVMSSPEAYLHDSMESKDLLVRSEI